MSTASSASPGPLAGLYLHVPFCSAICPYCDFAVTTGSEARRRDYALGLQQEIALWVDVSLRFQSIYLGGGTPTALPDDELVAVLESARAAFEVAPDARVSMEANPEDLVESSTAAWRAAGVGTISLGVQSFDDAELRFLGRRHDCRQAVRAVELARSAGFETVSIDLIFGLPGQSEESWERSLRQAGCLGVDHVSCYQLTIHEGTPFERFRAKGRLVELGEDPQADLYALAHATLGELGFEAYEVSNFARSPEHRSLHNMGYWDHSPYLGLGVSAHSFVDAERWWNLRGIPEWGQAIRSGRRPIEGRERLGAGALALEELMLALRTADGLDLAGYRARYGVDLVAVNAAVVEELVAAGVLVADGARLRCTARGLAVADGLARALQTGLEDEVEA